MEGGELSGPQSIENERPKSSHTAPGNHAASPQKKKKKKKNPLYIYDIQRCNLSASGLEKLGQTFYS